MEDASKEETSQRSPIKVPLLNLPEDLIMVEKLQAISTNTSLATPSAKNSCHK